MTAGGSNNSRSSSVKITASPWIGPVKSTRFASASSARASRCRRRPRAGDGGACSAASNVTPSIQEPTT